VRRGQSATADAEDVGLTAPVGVAGDALGAVVASMSNLLMVTSF